MLIGLDGDDTLWKNEDFFTGLQLDLQSFLGDIGCKLNVHDTLLAIETENVSLYGYGKKSFLLSIMEMVSHHIPAPEQPAVLSRVLTLGHQFMRQSADMLPGVPEALEAMAEFGRLVIITKGDIAEQTQKIEDCGISLLVPDIEIVNHKDQTTYERVISRHRHQPDEPFVMIGNSIKSDILPVIALGHNAIHIPYHVTWAYENEVSKNTDYIKTDSLINAVHYLEQISKTGSAK